MSRKLKPLILIDSSIVGGPGRGIFQLVRGLKEHSIDYLLCNFRYNKPKSEEFVQEAERQGINLARLRQRFKFDPSPLWQLQKIVTSGRFSLIQSHGYKSHILAAAVSYRLRMPWVAFTHGSTAEDFKVKVYHSIDRILLRYATVVVAVSPELRDTFAALRGPSKRTEFIPNAVDKEAILRSAGGQAVRADLKCADSDLLIGCFGRLSYEKGQDILIQAFSAVHSDFPQARLLILGSGPDEEKLKSLSGEFGIQDKVFFRAHTSAMGDYYEALDLLVLPSRSEGLPNVMLEAMAHSVPVAASAVGAVGIVLEDELNGWIFSPRDAAAAADTLRSVLSSRERMKEIGRAGQVSLLPKFCPRFRNERILSLYSDLITPPSAKLS